MSSDGVNQGRRRVLTAMTSVVGAAGAVGIAVPFVGSWNPSARAKAAGAPVEVNIAKLEPGQLITVEWRGKPVYVLRRTEQELESLSVMEPDLRDPNSDESVQPEDCKNPRRSIKEHIVVLLGVCTHLGCAPEFAPEVGAVDIGAIEWQGGFFCKCHGSKFDLAGRVLKGVPAPINLAIPPHKYIGGGDVLFIGEGEA